MPTLNMNINVPVDPVVASDILKDATKIIAKTIGKPESYVMVVINGGVPIAFAGSEEPAAYGEIVSVGGISPAVNGKLSSALTELLETKLSVDSSRFYIKFYDVELRVCNVQVVRYVSKHVQLKGSALQRSGYSGEVTAELEGKSESENPNYKFSSGSLVCQTGSPVAQIGIPVWNQKLNVLNEDFYVEILKVWLLNLEFQLG